MVWSKVRNDLCSVLSLSVFVLNDLVGQCLRKLVWTAHVYLKNARSYTISVEAARQERLGNIKEEKFKI